MPDDSNNTTGSDCPSAPCSALIVSEKTKRINVEVRAENGEAEKKLRRVCQSEQRSRTSVIAEYGDPRDWDQPCIVCGGEEPCSHDFNSVSWPNASLSHGDEIAR